LREIQEAELKVVHLIFLSALFLSGCQTFFRETSSNEHQISWEYKFLDSGHPKDYSAQSQKIRLKVKTQGVIHCNQYDKAASPAAFSKVNRLNYIGDGGSGGVSNYGSAKVMCFGKAISNIPAKSDARRQRNIEKIINGSSKQLCSYSIQSKSPKWSVSKVGFTSVYMEVLRNVFEYTLASDQIGRQLANLGLSRR